MFNPVVPIALLLLIVDRWTYMRFMDPRSISGYVLLEYEDNAAIRRLAACIPAEMKSKGCGE